MFCPFISYHDGEEQMAGLCLRDDCGLWVPLPPKEGECAFKVLANELMIVRLGLARRRD